MFYLYWIHARTICYLLLIRREAERGGKKIINEMSRSNTQTHTSNGHNFSSFSQVLLEAKQQPILLFICRPIWKWMDGLDPSFCLSFIPPKDLLVAEFLRWNQLGLTSSQGWSSGSPGGGRASSSVQHLLTPAAQPPPDKRVRLQLYLHTPPTLTLGLARQGDSFVISIKSVGMSWERY